MKNPEHGENKLFKSGEEGVVLNFDDLSLSLS